MLESFQKNKKAYPTTLAFILFLLKGILTVKGRTLDKG